MYENAIEVLNILKENNYEAYIVGGFPRDLYLNKKSSDVDICTNARPKDLTEIFDDTKITNIDYGCVIIKYKNTLFSITTFRSDNKYIDSRKPESINYVDELLDDLSRRDFIINTMCIDADKNTIDLLNAKDTLLEIIEEMDTVMKEEFTNTFKLIQKEFEVVFKQLFNGGKANLKLTDPDNILETGVEIIASPPGKKLTTISLLSGGEKTLTAISLLFAILNIRPIPFCLFDEVEAALDEANVDNFGKYLDHYKEKTQFLLITHKKKTMEYANTLYGITMQESGVSKLVSVKLENN